jgi:hypothetical protein
MGLASSRGYNLFDAYLFVAEAKKSAKLRRCLQGQPSGRYDLAATAQLVRARTDIGHWA